MPTATRYSAACAAALAGCGQGKDADKLDGAERSRWRRQALDWLRQDLKWWEKALAEGNTRSTAQVREWMRRWQTDTEIAMVRTPEALTGLSVEERDEWKKFWSDVGALLRRANSKSKEGSP